MSAHTTAKIRGGILLAISKRYVAFYRYHQYRDFWTNLKAPGEKSHKNLRWEVKAQMMYKEEPAPVIEYEISRKTWLLTRFVCSRNRSASMCQTLTSCPPVKSDRLYVGRFVMPWKMDCPYPLLMMSTNGQQLHFVVFNCTLVFEECYHLEIYFVVTLMQFPLFHV